jgi:hypothetical protein
MKKEEKLGNLKINQNKRWWQNCREKYLGNLREKIPKDR